MFIKICYQFLEHLKTVKNGSEHTIRNYSIDLNALKNFLEKEQLAHCKAEELPDKIRYNLSYAERWTGNDELLNLESIDKKVLRRFLADLSAQSSNKSTVVRRISSLRTFFKFATQHGFIKTNPAEDLESPKPDKRIPISLSFDQVKRLLEQPDTSNYLEFRDRAMMELFYSSGLRVSELIGLNRADLNLEELLMRIRGKGKKERVIPITQNAATWISSYLNHPERFQEIDGHLAEIDHEAVFLNKLGTRLSTRSVDRGFEKYLKASGLSGRITPHTIRHTIATHWLENGMDLKTIQTLLGHHSVAATTIYTKVSPKLKKEVYDNTHPHA